MNIATDPEALRRFWANVGKEGECWPWLGKKDNTKGIFRFKNEKLTARQMIWLVTHSELPNKRIMVSCDMHDCVNPEHLFLEKSIELPMHKFNTLIGREGECWPWLGQLRSNIGIMRFQGRNISTRRIMWMKTYGIMPERRVKVSCNIPHCLNPEHLYLEQTTDNYTIDEETINKFNILIGREGECWPWLGSINDSTLIGVFRLFGKPVSPRRIIWFLTYGDYPEKPIRISCSMSHCVNPKHLYVI